MFVLDLWYHRNIFPCINPIQKSKRKIQAFASYLELNYFYHNIYKFQAHIKLYYLVAEALNVYKCSINV